MLHPLHRPLNRALLGAATTLFALMPASAQPLAHPAVRAGATAITQPQRPLPGALPTSELPDGWQLYNQGLARAKALGKHVMIQFYAPGCAPCQRMGEDVTADPALDELVRKHFVLIRVNRDSARPVRYRGKTVSEKQLAARHQVQAFPTLLFLAPNGQLIGRHVGDLPTPELHEVMQYVASGAYDKMEYKAFKARRR